MRSKLSPGPVPANLRLPTAVEEQAQGDGEAELSLQRMVLGFGGLLRRRWRSVALIWVLVLIPVLAYAITAIPEYSSRGAIQVSDTGSLAGANPLIELAGGAAGSGAKIQTEVEIIKRRGFRTTVLKRLRLHVIDPEQPTKVTTDVDIILGRRSPVSDDLRHLRESLQVVELSDDRFVPLDVVIAASSERQLTVTLGHDEPRSYDLGLRERLDTDDLSLQFDALPVPVGESIRVQVIPDGELLRRYEDRISVDGLGTLREPTNIVEVSVLHADRDIAQAIVATTLDLYLERTLEHQTRSALKAAEFIREQLNEVRENVQKAEEKLLRFSQESGAIQLDTQAKVAIETAAQLEAQRLTVELQEKTIGSVLSRLKRRQSSHASLTANFFEDPVLAAAVTALMEAETKYETALASFTSDHPQVIELGRALERQRQHVTALLSSAKANLASQRAQLETKLEESDRAMRGYPDTKLELARLMRDTQVSQRMYTLLLEKLEEAEILKASTTTDKRVVDRPAKPDEKATPRRSKLVVLGSGVGLVLGVAFAVFAQILQRRIDSVAAVREVVPFPAYGTIPEVAENAGTRLSVADVWRDPNGSLPEAFRALGVSVALLPADRARGKLLMVTSGQPGEGKSTVAANLAEALSRSGKRVLLVDLDLRRPTQHRLWGVRRAPGYSDLIAQGGGPEGLKQFGRSIEPHHTCVLTAGTRLPDTVAAIMSPQLEALLEQWVADYDFVLLDAPPAFVAETLAVADLADLILLVTRPGIVERANLRHAIDALDRLDVAKGLILNGVSKKHSEYQYGSGYYYYANRYGEDDAANSSAATGT